MTTKTTNSADSVHSNGCIVYVQGGGRLLRDGASLFLQIAIFFSIPAIAAAALAVAVPVSAVWKTLLLFLLQSVTTLVAPVVFMIAVSAVMHGDDMSLRCVVRRSLPWVPRYLWTNAHTSVIFWVPMGALVLLQSLISEPLATNVTAHQVTAVGTGVVLVLTGLVLHSHTLLAPFLAVHGDMPGSLAALESWRLARRNLPLVMSTLVLASLPAALPLAFVGGALALLYSEQPLMAIALPYFTGVVLQCIRLPLMPAAYVLYCDLWQSEQARRVLEGDPPVPAPVRLLLDLSRWRPSLAR